jgi:hypothetical protein
MAVNEDLAREMRNHGLPWALANMLADPSTDTINGAAVDDPADLTAPESMGASYSATNVNALRADVLALQTTLTELTTSLRDAGVISS